MTKAEVFTPVLKSTGERLTIKNPIFGDLWVEGRGLRKKGVVYDPRTGKRYEVTGKACDIPNCQCDAWAVEISN